MKQRKKIYKIGLSLLIALFMLVPAGISMDTGESEARDEPRTEWIEQKIRDEGPISQVDPCEVGVLSLDSIEPNADGFIADGCYPFEITIENEPGCGPALVKTFVDVYKKTEGEHIVMYETSFEDNYDIYNNWIQIDADSGTTGGFYDSWDWSDARASDGDHSMKTTMYDIYKGNQDDYLQCTKSFDMSDQDAINVSFDVWVDGQGGDNVMSPYSGYDIYSVMDYIDFEIGDQYGFPYYANPDTSALAFIENQYWYWLYGDYYFFDTSIYRYSYAAAKDYTPITEDIGGGWWHVWCEIPVPVLASYYGFDVTDIMFRFSWHSDPEFQYEGGYIDNFKVVSIESMEEKIFQTHSQGPFEVPEGLSQYTFPLEWCPEVIPDKELQYDIKVWLETLDLDHTSLSDWGMPGMLDIFAIIGDWFDPDVTDITITTSFGEQEVFNPGTGVMEQGDDAHILATVHLNGTVPATDVPVTATAYPISWETVYSTECENGIGWAFQGSTHVTDKDSWSGEKSFGFFDEETFEYEFDCQDTAYSPKIDFDVEELYMDFYYKCNTEPDDDYFAPGFSSPYFNYILGSGYHGAHGTLISGLQLEWVGPLQPICRYNTVNLLDMYDWYEVYMKDGSGNLVTEVNVGGFFTADGDIINYDPDSKLLDPPIMWSGLFVDDISVRALKTGDPVWTQTIIVPGPWEPCITEEVQFEWEDVPYSNYKIVIESHPDGACGNNEDEGESAQILVVSDLEMAHWKEMESIDYSEAGEGEFGPSTSDYDWYLASNYQYWLYPGYSNSVAIVSPGGINAPDDCPNAIDIGHDPTLGETLTMEFDAWWDLEQGFDFVVLEVANCPADLCTDWHEVIIDPCNYGYAEYTYMWGGTQEWAEHAVFGTDWFAYYYPCLPAVDVDGWVRGITVDLLDTGDGPIDFDQFISVRFRIETDANFNQRGIKIDNVAFPDLDPELNNGLGTDPDTGVFYDTMGDIDGSDLSYWEMDVMHYGQFWEYNAVDNEWCADFPDCGGIVDGLIWDTEIMDAYEAYLTFETKYHLNPDAVAQVQISSDGGVTWFTLYEYTGNHGGWSLQAEHTDISAHAGKRVLIRFIYENHGTDGDWCIRNLMITGKKDTSAPTSDITMTGTMKDSGWYATAVSITLTADDEGSGVKEIHYVLDGVETVIAGDTATFTVSGDGEHNIEFWAVDFTGNEGVHTTVPTFRIDSGSPPTVAITAPEPGLYLFGNKLLSASKVIIIGSFTIEATASDAESGIYRVQFYLDGDIIAEDTEAPFSAYCAEKHSGAGTIKVVAEDFAQNTAEDTLDITYFKFL